MLELTVDTERLVAELEKLASFSDCPEPPPAVTRIVFTETDTKARQYLRSLYEDAGLTVRVDPMGNTFARWVGSEPDAPAVGTGSHCDALPYAGMYDGTYGVVGGLAAIRTLQAAGFQPKRSIELVMFTSEEPTRFGLGFMLTSSFSPLLGERSFGHPGAGGSLGFGDPDHGVGFGYVMSKMNAGLSNDPRSRGLIDALRGCL